MKAANAERNKAPEGNDWIELVGQQVASLRLGVVAITVHGSKVVQIGKPEKLRLSQKDQTGEQKNKGAKMQTRTE